MTTQPNWDRRVGSATEELVAFIEKERAVNEATQHGNALLDNSQNKPKYSLKTSWVIGGIILALMLYGVYLGVQHGY